MPRSRKSKRLPIDLVWPKNTELMGLELQLQPQENFTLSENYTTQFYSWFLDQVRRIAPTLLAYLHDGQSEKPFTVSGLHGPTTKEGKLLHFSAEQFYQWSVTGLSHSVVDFLRQWLQQAPAELQLRISSFAITRWSFSQSPTTYAQLLPKTIPDSPSLTLSFVSPFQFQYYLCGKLS